MFSEITGIRFVKSTFGNKVHQLKANDNGVGKLATIMQSRYIRDTLKRSNELAFIIKYFPNQATDSNRQLVFIDVDLPRNSDVVNGILSYLGSYLALPSRHGNTHVILAVSSEYYAELQQCDGKNGLLRYSNGANIPHPTDKDKRTEFALKLHGLNTNFNLLKWYGAEKLLNADSSFFEWLQYKLDNKLNNLELVDDRLRKLRKAHYATPRPKAKAPSKPYLNKKVPHSFDLDANITFCKKLFDSEWLLLNQGDSSAFIHIIGNKAAKILAKYDNLTPQNLEYALWELIPEWLQGKYSNVNSKGYSRQWLNREISKIVEDV